MNANGKESVSAAPPAALGPSQDLLWRQVHPGWIEADGRITSQAFVPTFKDADRLSCTQSTKVGAQASYDYHVSTLGLASAGVWAVSLDEVISVQYAAYDDSVSSDTPGHAYIDTEGVAKAERKRRARRLVAFAQQRGQQYPPRSA